MTRIAVVLLGVVAAVAAVATFSGAGTQDATAASSGEQVGASEPRSSCEARRVGQAVQVNVRLQLTDDDLDVTADNALVVADLGTTTQSRPLAVDKRSDGAYTVTFDRLPADVRPSSFAVWASPSPDDPGSFRCDDSSVAGPAPTADGNLPRSGG